MDYLITIPDGINWGIGAARAAYNESIPQTIPDPENPGGPEIPNPKLKADDLAYVNYVMQHAAASYCLQYPDADPNPEATTLAIQPYLPQ